METKPENKTESLNLRIDRNNCSLRHNCRLCECYDRPDVPWCLTTEEGYWVCPACAKEHNPLMAEVVESAIEGHFAKYREAVEADQSRARRGYPEPPKTKEIEKIQAMAAGLDMANPRLLAEQLRELRRFTHDYEYQTDMEVREAAEAAAEAKVMKMIEAGVKFQTITVDKVPFYFDETDNLHMGHPPCPDDDIPF